MPTARTPKRRRVTFRLRLTGFALALIALSMGTASLLAYHLSKKTLEKHLENELLAIVRTAAPLVDGDLLPLIYRDQSGALAGADEFEEIRKLLEKVKLGNTLESHGSPLYVLRAAPDFLSSGHLEFVVMTDKDTGGRYFAGNYLHAPAHYFPAMRGVPSSSGIYSDSEGAWISAAAPVRNSSGQVVGILQADRPVNLFYREARKLAAYILLAALASLAASGPHLRGIHAGRWFHDAAVRRNRPGPEHLAATGPIDGRTDLGGKRAGSRQQVPFHGGFRAEGIYRRRIRRGCCGNCTRGKRRQAGLRFAGAAGGGQPGEPKARRGPPRRMGFGRSRNSAGNASMWH